jgi:hypothetical protein
MLNVTKLNFILLNVIMLNVTMLNVTMLNVIMLSVLAPFSRCRPQNRSSQRRQPHLDARQTSGENHLNLFTAVVYYCS